MFVWTDAIWLISYLGKCYLVYVFFSPFSSCSLLHIACEMIVWNKASELKCCRWGRTRLSPFWGQCLWASVLIRCEGALWCLGPNSCAILTSLCLVSRTLASFPHFWVLMFDAFAGGVSLEIIFFRGPHSCHSRWKCGGVFSCFWPLVASDHAFLLGAHGSFLCYNYTA